MIDAGAQYKYDGSHNVMVKVQNLECCQRETAPLPKRNGKFTSKIKAAIITCCNFGTDMIYDLPIEGIAHYNSN